MPFWLLLASARAETNAETQIQEGVDENGTQVEINCKKSKAVILWNIQTPATYNNASYKDINQSLSKYITRDISKHGKTTSGIKSRH